MAHPTELHFITCDFGTPGSWEAGYHTGRDYRARTPTPVFATRAGVVRHAGTAASIGDTPSPELLAEGDA